MPCPRFEPQRIALYPTHSNARLPLFDEYDGVCHAAGQPAQISEDSRFRFCNHGYSHGECGHSLQPDAPSCNRFAVLSRDCGSLELLCVEEQEYAPVRWLKVRFSIAEERLEPEPPDTCLRAQVRAFCRSYLRRFPNQ